MKTETIKKGRKIDLPDNLLSTYLNSRELADFKQSGSGIYSVTIYADKLDEGSCCETKDSGCCGSEENATSEKTSCCGTESNTGTGCC